MQVEIRTITDWITIIPKNQQRSHIGMAHESFAQSLDAVISMHSICHVAGPVENGRDGK